MNTTENNKKLAGFLQWEVKHYSTPICDIVTPFGQLTETQLKFHNDWNWLMLVVDKIEDLGYTVETKINWCRIKENGETISLRWETDATKIEAVYNACIEFVEWYKEQNNKQGNG